MQHLKRYFPFYWDERGGKLWLEVSRFGEEFLYVEWLSSGLGSNPVGLDRGQAGVERVVHFERVGPKIVLVERNLRYRADNWNGTMSFWLNLDPEKDLKPGFCDPIQVTDKAWNKAALWVDFSKDEVPRHFRYGAFADYAVWNPTNRKFEEIAPTERPWIVVERPPFGRGRWIHVVMTFSGFNRSGTGGVARLFLDAKLQGELKDRPQVFTWDISKTRILLGIAYIGLMDDLALFDRALSPQEVKALHHLPRGVAELYKAP